jgi:hypothetical protein
MTGPARISRRLLLAARTGLGAAGAAALTPGRARLVDAATTSTASRTARPASTAHSSRRSAALSTSSPAGNPNTSQGRLWATSSPDTASGFPVSLAASSGSAAALIPSPRLASAEELHSRQ